MKAEQMQPNTVGRYEEHPFWPQYLGGPSDGPKLQLPAGYQQLLADAFKRRLKYGQGRLSEEKAKEILTRVYSKYPVPTPSGTQNP